MYNVHRMMNDEKYTKKRAQPSLPTSLSGQKIHYMKRADVGWWPPTTHLWKQIARNISAWTGRIFSLMLTKNMCDCRPWFILIFHVSVCAADTIVHIPWSLDIWRDPLQVPACKSGGSIHYKKRQGQGQRQGQVPSASSAEQNTARSLTSRFRKIESKVGWLLCPE